MGCCCSSHNIGKQQGIHTHSGTCHHILADKCRGGRQGDQFKFKYVLCKNQSINQSINHSRPQRCFPSGTPPPNLSQPVLERCICRPCCVGCCVRHGTHTDWPWESFQGSSTLLSSFEDASKFSSYPRFLFRLITRPSKSTTSIWLLW